MEHLNTTPLSALQVREWTKQDPVCHSAAIGADGLPEDSLEMELQPFAVRSTESSVQDGCLLRGVEWLAGRQQILNELHCGHLGLARMKSIAQMYVWWPKMDEQMEKTVFLNSRVWLGRLPKEMTCSLLNWNNYTSNVSMPIQASSSGNEKEKEWYDYKYPCKWSIRYK